MPLQNFKNQETHEKKSKDLEKKIQRFSDSSKNADFTQNFIQQIVQKLKQFMHYQNIQKF